VLTDEGHPGAQVGRIVETTERIESCTADTFDERRGGVVAWRRGCDTLVEHDRAEPQLAALHEVVAGAIPLQRIDRGDLGGEGPADVDAVERGGQADACPAAIAVEVGNDHERFVGERIGSRHECARSRTQLELARLPSSYGEPIGKAVGQEQPGGR
jgi:hypothetical protein